MRFSIGQKLWYSFGVVIVLIFFATLLNTNFLSAMNKSQHKVVEQRYPMVIAGKELVNGINQSLAALRGYMILGGHTESANKFVQEREQAWQQIHQSVKTIESLSLALDSDDMVINNVKQLLDSLEVQQQSIEDIAQKPENQPARALLLNDAGPKASDMLKHLQQMIEIEADLPADDERKTLLKFLADSYGAFATSVGGLRAYLITGDSQFKDQFDVNWQFNTDAYLEIDETIDLLTDEQLTHWQQYESLREEFAPISIEMFRLRQSEKWNIANHRLEHDVEPLVDQITRLLTDMSKLQANAARVDVIELEDTLNVVFFVMFAAAVVVLLVAIGTAAYIVRIISSSMEMLVKHSDEIANGNLTCDEFSSTLLDSKDEFGELARDFQEMGYSLSDMISWVKEYADQMDNATVEVAELSDKILAASKLESSRSGEVSEATEQLMKATQSNLELANVALEIVNESEAQARLGIDAVESTINEMANSVNEVNNTSEVIAALNEASQQIYNITDTISQIADQTNLLALNAAVEAARAGEHGRGFAVVADEVRSLAVKTSDATVEITQQIKVLKDKVEESISSMSRAADYVYASQNKAAVTADAINSINDRVTQISASNSQISQSANVQMQQLQLLKDKLTKMLDTLKDDGERAMSVMEYALLLDHITDNVNDSLAKFVTYPDRHLRELDLD